MASVYIINYSDPAKPTFPVLPGTVNTSSTSLSLPGHGVTSYGELVDENLVHLLENFAHTVAPANPIQGQLWFNTTTNVLQVFDTTLGVSGEWKSTGGIFVSTTAPASPSLGQLWYDTDISDDSGQFTVSQLKVWNGSAWVSIAANYVLKTGDTMSGFLTLHADPVNTYHASTKQYTDTKVAKAGDSMTGALAMGTNKITDLGDATLATDALNMQTGDARYVNISGDTMTGALVLNANPTLALHAATKQYVDLMRVYDITGGTIGKPRNNTLIMNFVAVRSFTLPTNFTDSKAQAGVVATAPSTFSIKKNNVSIGSLLFGTGSATGAFTVASPQTIVAGDYLQIVAPASVDTTLADIRVTLKGTLV